MWLIDWTVKIIFYFWLGVAGVGLTDVALQLHDTTAAAYRKGPISAGLLLKC